MGEHTLLGRTPSALGGASFAPAARRWAEAAPGAFASGGAGHDFARISISPPLPSATAPIQRHKWTWDATKKSWSSPSASSSDTPPSHEGSSDGEEYDDTYGQSTDPTVTPHLKKGAEHFGESGAEEQLKGRNPSAEDIREVAVTSTGRRGGSGLHEVIPTNMRGEVAKSKSEPLIGVQSGMRTSTDYQTFSPSATGTGQVGGHTGMFRKTTGSGSTHTKGQAPAHDTLREAMESVETETDPDMVVNTMALQHLKSTPTGQEVLKSDYLTGAMPNVSSIGTLGPVATTGNPPDPERLKLAQDVHERREHVKARERGRARERDPQRTRLPSPSPERTPIDSSGQGGEYVKGDRTTWSTAPVPSFKGKGWKQVANEGAWLTQPQRHPYDVKKAPLVKPSASNSNVNNSNANIVSNANPSSAPVTTTQPVVTTSPLTTTQPVVTPPLVTSTQPITIPPLTPTQPVTTPNPFATQPVTPSNPFATQPITPSLPLTSFTAPPTFLPPPTLPLQAPLIPPPQLVPTPPTVTPMVTTPVTPPANQKKRKQAPPPSPTVVRRNPKRAARGVNNPFG